MLYADDTIILADSYEKLKLGIAAVEEFCQRELVRLNGAKSEYIIFNAQFIENLGGQNKSGVSIKQATESLKQKRQLITVDRIQLNAQQSIKYLGVILSSKLKSKEQLEMRKIKATRSLAMARSTWIDSEYCSGKHKIFLYQMYIRSVLLYGMEITQLTSSDMMQLDRHDHCLLKNIFGLPRRTKASKFFISANIQRATLAILERKLTLLRNLCAYELTRDLLIKVSTQFNNSTEEAKAKFKESWIHELANEVSSTQFLMEETNNLLLDKLNKAYQEENALFQHDHEVKAICQFITCPSNLI